MQRENISVFNWSFFLFFFAFHGLWKGCHLWPNLLYWKAPPFLISEIWEVGDCSDRQSQFQWLQYILCWPTHTATSITSKQIVLFLNLAGESQSAHTINSKRFPSCYHDCSFTCLAVKLCNTVHRTNLTYSSRRLGLLYKAGISSSKQILTDCLSAHNWELLLRRAARSCMLPTTCVSATSFRHLTSMHSRQGSTRIKKTQVCRLVFYVLYSFVPETEVSALSRLSCYKECLFYIH